MQFSKEELKQKFLLPLPGIDSHVKMAPLNRVQALIDNKNEAANAKKSAVLINFFHDDEILKMIVIRRSKSVGIHAGQIAFPGGRYEDEDKTVLNTALREIEEEIGISADKIEIIGRLSDIYVPPSNFLISIFVGYLNRKPIYTIQESEVDEVIEIPFNLFFENEVIKQKDFVVSENRNNNFAPYYDIPNASIWGASAMVISELLDILSS